MQFYNCFVFNNFTKIQILLLTSGANLNPNIHHSQVRLKNKKMLCSVCKLYNTELKFVELVTEIYPQHSLCSTSGLKHLVLILFVS